jgi:hypothetical protein
LPAGSYTVPEIEVVLPPEHDTLHCNPAGQGPCDEVLASLPGEKKTPPSSVSFPPSPLSGKPELALPQPAAQASVEESAAKPTRVTTETLRDAVVMLSRIVGSRAKKVTDVRIKDAVRH